MLQITKILIVYYKGVFQVLKHLKCACKLQQIYFLSFITTTKKYPCLELTYINQRLPNF